MSKSKTMRSLIALATAGAAVSLAACGSAPGSTGGSNGGASSDEAKTAAQLLGIDLDDCPTDITEAFPDEINVGGTLPLSGGPAAAYAVVADGMKAAIGEANDTLGLSTKLNLTLKDDQFAPDKAVAGVTELIQKDQAPVLTGVTGTPSVTAISELLSSNCVPLLPAGSGAPIAYDAKANPWIVSVQMPFKLDAYVWMANVVERFPDGAKIAMLTANTESGQGYISDIESAVKEAGSKYSIVARETIEAAESGPPSSQITTLRNSGADVLFTAPTGAQCISIPVEAANQGWDVVTYLSNICGSTAYFDQIGDAGKDVMVSLFTKDPHSARFKNDEAVKKATALVEKYSPGATVNTTTFTGLVYAGALIQAMSDANGSDLGLSTLGVLDAAHHLSYHPDLFIDGIDIKLDGTRDQYGIEAAELNAWNGKSFDPVKVYSFEGELTKK